MDGHAPPPCPVPPPVTLATLARMHRAQAERVNFFAARGPGGAHAIDEETALLARLEGLLIDNLADGRILVVEGVAYLVEGDDDHPELRVAEMANPHAIAGRP